MEERAALETKYSDICKPLYKKRGNFVAIPLDDKIEEIHKEGGGKNEEERSKGDNDDDDAGEGEERERDTCLEDVSNNDKIYGAIASRQGTTTTNTKDDTTASMCPIVHTQN